MNINATIILQAINFGIAYFIFRFILLKPAYAAIVADNKKKEHLESLVVDDKNRIERQQKEIADQRYASYIFFKQHIPSKGASVVIDRAANVQPIAPQLDRQQVIQMRHTLSDAIVSMIGDQHASD